MTPTGLKAGIAICLVLGIADIGALTFWLAPAAWPPAQTTAIGPAAGDPTTAAKAAGEPVVKAPAAEPAAKAPTAEPGAKAPAAEPAAKAPTAEPVAKAPAAEPAAKAPTAEPVAKAPAVAPAPPAWSGPRKRVFMFPTNQYLLSHAARRSLDELAGAIRASPGLTMSVEGHSDKRGESDFNMKLSRLRALSVVQYLQNKKLGVRIRFHGYGSSRPALVEDTPDAWAKNRRVVVHIKKDKP